MRMRKRRGLKRLSGSGWVVVVEVVVLETKDEERVFKKKKKTCKMG